MYDIGMEDFASFTGVCGVFYLGRKWGAGGTSHVRSVIPAGFGL